MDSLATAPSIRNNVETWLKALDWEGALAITKEGEDRCYGYFRDLRIPLSLLTSDRWWKNPKASTEHFHGRGGVSWREKNVTPSAQITLFPACLAEPIALWDVFFELDFDERFGLGHAWEVVRNTITGSKTDQAKIAELLVKRFS